MTPKKKDLTSRKFTKEIRKTLKKEIKEQIGSHPDLSILNIENLVSGLAILEGCAVVGFTLDPKAKDFTTDQKIALLEGMKRETENHPQKDKKPELAEHIIEVVDNTIYYFHILNKAPDT